MHIAYIDIETNAINDWLNLTDLETVHCLCVMQNGGDGCLSYNSQRGDIEQGWKSSRMRTSSSATTS